MPLAKVIGRTTERAGGSRRRCLSRPGAGLMALLLGACTAGVPVRSDFPSPVIEPLPLTAGVYYEPAFRKYRYSEKLPKGRHWTVELGAANVQLFDRVLSRLFAQSVPVKNVAAAATDRRIDVVVAPSVDKFEFALPEESGARFIEAWVRYNVRLYAADGELIIDWPIAGYGKEATDSDGGATDHVSQAAYVAMRDVAATMSLDFSDQPEISDWLERNRGPASPGGAGRESHAR